MWRRRLQAVIFYLVLIGTAFGQCTKDNRSDKKKGILITDLSITGTQSFTSDQLAEITGELTGDCFDDDEDMEQRVRITLQERGYYAAQVKSLKLKPLDPLGAPKPVAMEADIIEGPRYKFGEINFVNNHAFSMEKLRQEFPIKTGDWFQRSKVGYGMASLLKLYASSGFLDARFTFDDTASPSSGTVNLTLSVVDEGPQYHMGKLEIIADKGQGDRLQLEWKLAEGAVYDSGYIDEFVAANRDLLPPGFGRKDIELAEDCPRASVAVTLLVNPSKDSPSEKAKSVPCKENEKQKHASKPVGL
jgi:outer membrane protein assembly factor BamA